MTKPYLMIDRATYGDELISTASQMGALAIAGYVYDHFLADINGYCGGWTPQAIQRIYAAGLDFHPIFVFRDGELPPDPARCVEILRALGVRSGAWCHGDYESGAMQTPAQAAALTSALHGGGFRSAPYGTAGTLNQGYLAGADAPWVAYYLAQPWDNLAGVDLANLPNVGVWQYAAWQYANSASVNGVVVDVSISNLPIGGVLAATATEEPVTQDEFNNLLANNPDFQALIWRMEALVSGTATVQGGPKAGETNVLGELVYRSTSMLTRGENDQIGQSGSGDPSYLRDVIAKAASGVAPHTHTVQGTAS